MKENTGVKQNMPGVLPYKRFHGHHP